MLNVIGSIASGQSVNLEILSLIDRSFYINRMGLLWLSLVGS